MYEILAAAVKREEQAFEIYSKIAASSVDDDIRHYAEILAKEELGHAALLRAMRRRVFHEYKVQTTKLLPRPDKVHSIDEFLTIATLLEMTLAKYMENISEPNVDLISGQKHIDKILKQLEVDINEDGDEDFNELDIVSNNLLSGTIKYTLDNLINECESIYEYYDSFILKAENEEIMNKALFLSSETLTLLTYLQDINKV